MFRLHLCRKVGDTEWAVAQGMPDLEVRWAALKPRLAHRFPFELDTFQKEAIIHLEQVRRGWHCVRAYQNRVVRATAHWIALSKIYLS